MTQYPEPSYTRSPSATWQWRKIKIKAAPAGEASANGVSSFQSRRLRDKNRELWIAVRYCGGPESSWLVTTRGASWRFPGYVAIEDVMGWANADR